MAVAVGTFASVVDHGSATVALPSIAEHFETDLPSAQWVLIGYALTISALLLPMGRLADLIGLKRVYVAGFVVFVVGAALAGTSTNMTSLVVFRLLQGAGAAMTQGTGMAVVVAAFPGSERGKALGLTMSVVGTGAVFGPVMGGMLVEVLDWRWVFFAACGLGVVSILVALPILDSRRISDDPDNDEAVQFDWPGAALSAAALVTFLLGMTAGPQVGWTSPLIVAAMVSFVSLLGSFIWWELHTSAPMLDMRLFQRRLFSFGVAAGFLNFLGMSSVRFLMPFYLQLVLGYTPARVGLIIVPGAASMIVMAPLSGRLSDRYGWRSFTVGGMLVSAAGLFLLSTLRVDSHYGLAMAGIMLQSTGSGIFNGPNNSSILSVVESSRYGVVSGFLNLVRNSANISSIALVTAIVTATMASMGHLPNLSAVKEASGTDVVQAFTSGLRTAYLTMGSVVVVGAAASLVKGFRRKSGLAEVHPREDAHRRLSDTF